jgi:hypothetical protein
LATSISQDSLPSLARELRAPRAAGIAGLVFSALFVTSTLLLRRHPPSGASLAELKAFYSTGDGRYVNLVGLYLAPFAGIAFLWFVAVARNRISRRADQFFDTIFLCSGVLFVAMLFAAAAAAGAIAAAIRFQNGHPPTTGGLELARALAYALLFTFGVKAAGVFMITTSTIGLRTHRLPRWLVYPSLALAAILVLSIAFFELIVLIFPIWVSVLSTVILIRDDVADDPPALPISP